MLRNNVLIALFALGSSSQGRLRAKRSAVSTLSCAPNAMFGRFGRFGRKRLVRGLTFGAEK